jgi:hypothetical protein
MIVKVIKSNDIAWYKDFIGRLCEVRGLDDEHYIVAGSDFNLIAIDDCEVMIKDEDEWILI